MQSPADWPHYVHEEFQNASTAEELAKVCVFIKFHINLDKEKFMEFKAKSYCWKKYKYRYMYKLLFVVV
jgi:hypothetical protein